MAHVNERLGKRECPLCKAELVIRRNPAGTVTGQCAGADGCDLSFFAKKGTPAADMLTKGMGGDPPAPAPGPTPAPPAPTRRKAEPFALSQLGGGS